MNATLVAEQYFPKPFNISDVPYIKQEAERQWELRNGYKDAAGNEVEGWAKTRKTTVEALNKEIGDRSQGGFLGWGREVNLDDVLSQPFTDPNANQGRIFIQTIRADEDLRKRLLAAASEVTARTPGAEAQLQRVMNELSGQLSTAFKADQAQAIKAQLLSLVSGNSGNKVQEVTQLLDGLISQVNDGAAKTAAEKLKTQILQGLSATNGQNNLQALVGRFAEAASDGDLNTRKFIAAQIASFGGQIDDAGKIVFSNINTKALMDAIDASGSESGIKNFLKMAANSGFEDQANNFRLATLNNFTNGNGGAYRGIQGWFVQKFAQTSSWLSNHVPGWSYLQGATSYQRAAEAALYNVGLENGKQATLMGFKGAFGSFAKNMLSKESLGVLGNSLKGSALSLPLVSTVMSFFSEDFRDKLAKKDFLGAAGHVFKNALVDIGARGLFVGGVTTAFGAAIATGATALFGLASAPAWLPVVAGLAAGSILYAGTNFAVDVASKGGQSLWAWATSPGGNQQPTQVAQAPSTLPGTATLPDASLANDPEVKAAIENAGKTIESLKGLGGISA